MKELTRLSMAISRVMSTQIMITNNRSTALVATPRDSPDIHWTPTGILERHFCETIKKNAVLIKLFAAILVALTVHKQVSAY